MRKQPLWRSKDTKGFVLNSLYLLYHFIYSKRGISLTCINFFYPFLFSKFDTHPHVLKKIIFHLCSLQVAICRNGWNNMVESSKSPMKISLVIFLPHVHAENSLHMTFCIHFRYIFQNTQLSEIRNQIQNLCHSLYHIHRVSRKCPTK